MVIAIFDFSRLFTVLINNSNTHMFSPPVMRIIYRNRLAVTTINLYSYYSNASGWKVCAIFSNVLID